MNNNTISVYSQKEGGYIEVDIIPKKDVLNVTRMLVVDEEN